MMIWAALPYEVRQSIYIAVGKSCYGSSAALAKLATVSREWQQAFEPFTFADLTLTSRCLETFVRIVLGSRRSFVRSIRFNIVLDIDYVTQNLQSKSRERKRAARSFSAWVSDLFEALSHWYKQDTPHGIHLQLALSFSGDASPVADAGPALSANCPYTSIVELDPDGTVLSKVAVVNGFRCTGRHIKPTSVLIMASRLRGLQALDVTLNHDSNGEHDVEERTRFATLLPQHATSVTSLRLRRPSVQPESTAPPSRRHSAPFYQSLLSFSQQCRYLTFDDTVDATALFDAFSSPNNISSNSGAVLFPVLEQLQVRNSYLIRRPYLRARNRVEALMAVSGLLLAIGRVVGRAPSLVKARVSQHMLSGHRIEWFVFVYTYCEGRAVLEVKGFEPSNVAVQAWEASVAETRGVQLVMKAEAAATGEDGGLFVE